MPYIALAFFILFIMPVICLIKQGNRYNINKVKIIEGIRINIFRGKFAGKRAGFKSPKDFPFIYIALASFRPSPSFYNARSNY
ncbi:unnamed protein product [Fusarium fujikuroi]|nr:unnamed protein product [Fusarium fujikuroi]